MSQNPTGPRAGGLSEKAILEAIEWLGKDGNYHQWCANRSSVTHTMCTEIPALSGHTKLSVSQRLRKIFEKHISLIVQYGSADRVPPETDCGAGIKFDIVHKVSMSNQNSIARAESPQDTVMRDDSPSGSIVSDVAAARNGESDSELDEPVFTHVSRQITANPLASTSVNDTPVLTDTNSQSRTPHPPSLRSKGASRSATFQRNAATGSRYVNIQGSTTPPQCATPTVGEIGALQNNFTDANTILAQILSQDREIRRQEVIAKNEHLRLEREHLQLEREQLHIIREQIQIQKTLTDQLMQALGKLIDKQ